MGANVVEELAGRIKAARAQDDERFEWMNVSIVKEEL